MQILINYIATVVADGLADVRCLKPNLLYIGEQGQGMNI